MVHEPVVIATMVCFERCRSCHAYSRLRSGSGTRRGLLASAVATRRKPVPSPVSRAGFMRTHSRWRPDSAAVSSPVSPRTADDGKSLRAASLPHNSGTVRPDRGCRVDGRSFHRISGRYSGHPAPFHICASLPSDTTLDFLPYRIFAPHPAEQIIGRSIQCHVDDSTQPAFNEVIFPRSAKQASCIFSHPSTSSAQSL